MVIEARRRADPAAPGLERVPPNAPEAERALLGSLLVDGAYMGSVVPLLRVDDFYEERHRDVFATLLDLYDRGKPLDVVVVRDELERRGLLDKVGGDEYLGHLAALVPSPAHADVYARLVRERAVARALIHTTAEIQRQAYDLSLPADELVDIAEKRILEISRTDDQEHSAAVKEILSTTIGELEDGGGVTGVPTGFPELDELTGGFQPGELIVVAGRPSMGKTSFAVNVAEHVAVVERLPVAIFTLEVSREQIVRNMLCSRARVEASRMRGGRFLTDEHRRKLVDAAEALWEAPLWVDDASGGNTLSLRARARRLCAKNGIRLLIVDYLQLMEAGTAAGAESRQQEITYISRSLKSLARELRIPVVAISQLNRAADSREDHKPRMSDLRESGAIEQDADLILFLFRKHYYTRDERDRGRAELIIAKQRNGPTDTVQLAFLDSFMRFERLASVDAF